MAERVRTMREACKSPSQELNVTVDLFRLMADDEHHLVLCRNPKVKFKDIYGSISYMYKYCE